MPTGGAWLHLKELSLDRMSASSSWSTTSGVFPTRGIMAEGTTLLLGLRRGTHGDGACVCVAVV